MDWKKQTEKNGCLLIAEAGVNHNGSLDLAYRLVDAAAEADCDCVKFQTYITEEDVLVSAETAAYQKTQGMGESQYEMLKRLELSFADFRKLKEYCEKKGILFLSTPFELKSLRFLDELGMPFWKIPSSDADHYPYLVAMAETRKPVILSSGMSGLAQIEETVRLLRRHGTEDLSILHCNTAYPTPYEDVSLLAMESIRERFGCRYGYSDHTVGIEVALAARALGATIIEKHFTLDRKMEGPDHAASMEPAELKQLVQGLRRVSAALGSREKVISASAQQNARAAKKSIVSTKYIGAGELFTEENLACKRPAGGLAPMRWPEILGQRARRSYEADCLIDAEELSGENAKEEAEM